MREQSKLEFSESLSAFVEGLEDHISTRDGQWTVKGFIDTFRNIYTISSDTKIVSKILEIHLFPQILHFAEQAGYIIVPADHQNYYPDISFVSAQDSSIKFAVDFKTTYRLPGNSDFCNGFTLGSHGKYFTDRESTKNIQFPYKEYSGHFCLGIIYNRNTDFENDETRMYQLGELHSIASVIKDFSFFVTEKWRIASDKGGSGNTANIGSIKKISDMIAGRGMFSRLGEEWFDDYWMNYGQITIPNGRGGTKKITTLLDFVEYRSGDVDLVVPTARRSRSRERNI